MGGLYPSRGGGSAAARPDRLTPGSDTVWLQSTSDHCTLRVVARLEIRSGPRTGQTIELTHEVVIGRENADVVIDDAEISRRHAVVRSVVGAVEVEDLGSSNGTFVDDQRIEGPTRVGGGAKIRLGKTVLEVSGVLPVQATRVSGLADPELTKPRPIADPQATRARPIPEPQVTRARPIADPQVTRARPIPEPAAPASAGAPTPPRVVVGEFVPPTARRSRGLASRSWVPVVLSFGSVVVTAIALVIYFSSHNTAQAAKHHPGTGGGYAGKPVGFVYTETNASPNNQVLIFGRYANGRLKRAGAVSTGGSGGHEQQGPCNPPGGCPSLDTQGEVVLTPDGKVLFAVNAGSNNITSFRVTNKGLRKVSLIDSGGKFPNSLTVHGNVLYVLNSNSTNIAGFRFSQTGRLTAIAGSTQPLLDGALPTAPRQIGFDPSGKLLMVTVLATTAGPPPAGGTANTIDTFPVSNGVAGAGTAHNSTTPFPFAFAFDSYGSAVVAQVNSFKPGSGNAQTYSVTNATMTPISGLSTNGYAPCWVAITHNQRYAYVVNSGNGITSTPTPGPSIAEYKLSGIGTLTLIGNTAPVSQFLETDDAVTPDDRYLYVVSFLEASPPSQTAPGNNSLINVYRVHRNGTLSFVTSTPEIRSPGLSGLAVK